MQIIRLHPQLCWISKPKGGASVLCFNKLSDSAACSSSRTTGLGYTKASNSKSQWLNTAKAYLLPTLNAHLSVDKGLRSSWSPRDSGRWSSQHLESHWWSWPRKKMWGITNCLWSPTNMCCHFCSQSIIQSKSQGTSNGKKVEKGFTHCGTVGGSS